MRGLVDWWLVAVVVAGTALGLLTVYASEPRRGGLGEGCNRDGSCIGQLECRSSFGWTCVPRARP